MTTAIATGFAALVLAALVVLRTRLVRVTVHGESMTPTLRPGQRVLVRRTRPTALHRGDLVVFRRPRETSRSWMIKRVLAAPGDPVPRADVPNLWGHRETFVPTDRLVVLGDNPAVSYDSRQFGYVHGDAVLGVVIRETPSPSSPPGDRS